MSRTILQTRILAFVFATAAAVSVNAQTNIMSNQGLETFTTCPNTLSQLTFATGYGQVTLHQGSPDYFNGCQTNTTAGVPTNVFGSTNANQGQAYAGGYTYLNYTGSLANYREYVVGTLSQTLVAGQSYVVSFQYAKSTNCKYGSDAYGFYLSNSWPSNGTSGNGSLPVTATSTNPTGNFLTSTSWSTYSDTIVANGGEYYITIGSFTNNANGTLVNNSASINGAYMYVDDVKIFIYNGVFGDSNICIGESASIYGILDTTYYWVNSSNPTVVLSTQDTLNVTPTQSTTYWAITYNDTFDFTVNVHNPPTSFVGNDTTICLGDTLERLVDLAGYSNLWSDNETDSLFQTVDSGYHWLEISIYNCTRRDSFHVSIYEFPEFDLGNDTTICTYDTPYLSTGLSSPLLFQWNTGASSPGLSVVNPGVYAVTVTNENCSMSDSIEYLQHPEVTVDLGQDKDFCYTPYAYISPVVQNANQFMWSNNLTSDSITVSSSGEYSLTVSNGFCYDSAKVQYNFYHEPVVSFSDDTARYCNGDAIELVPEIQSQLFTEYVWNTTATDASVFANKIGVYWMEASDEHCSSRDSIIVEMYDLLGVTLGEDQTICTGQSANLTPNTNVPVSIMNWSTGETSETIKVSEHGTYYVTVSNGICTEVDDINVFVMEYPKVNVGNDTSICPNGTFMLDATYPSEYTTYLWSDGSTAPTYKVESKYPERIWVETANGNCRKTDSIAISIRSTPSSFIGPDTAICPDDKIILDVDEDSRIQHVTWSTGDSMLSMEVGDTGTYSVSLFDGYCTTTGEIKVSKRRTPKEEDVTIDVPEIICLNQEFRVDLSNELITGYLWQDGSTGSSYKISEEGIYWVKATHRCGVLSDSIEINRCECPLWAPTAFNPDGDGNNDVFAPQLDCDPIKYELEIFDRFGELIYTSKNMNKGWDGKHRGSDVSAGTFAWKLTFEVVQNGKKVKNEENGTITVLR